MKLWDHESPIKWIYNKDYPSTVEEMIHNPDFKYFLDTDIVLLDDGRDGVYSFCTLDELRARYDVKTENPNAALRQIRSLMSRHVPTNSELSEISKTNENLIQRNHDEVSTLASTVTNHSGTIKAQNNNISAAMNDSREAVVKAKSSEITSESNSLALEEIIPLSLDTDKSVSANSKAIEDMIPMVLDQSSSTETISVAIEEIISSVYDESDRMKNLLDRIESISNSIQEIKEKVNSLNNRLDTLDSLRS